MSDPTTPTPEERAKRFLEVECQHPSGKSCPAEDTLANVIRAAADAARAAGFKAAIRLSIAQVGQRMGYTNAARLVDALRELEDDHG